MPSKPPSSGPALNEYEQGLRSFKIFLCVLVLACVAVVAVVLSLPPEPLITPIGKVGDCEVVKIYTGDLVVVCPNGVAIR